ncbi:hypothetical protein BZG36_01987 [Bifiguratus adelaidae]|uniref:Protein transport protein SFT2 n=1 Tax=Bifiguratus adelaidae TaxID=1938954 RepID=A0A261Y457_9FUNG|nr:hypothetical protein BZG36_01987 [Bifiguratus adelaidae]
MTESNFRESWQNWSNTRQGAGIRLNDSSTNVNSTLSDVSTRASNWFGSIGHSVQGYLPVGLGGNEPVEEPWYQLSRWERLVGCALCILLGAACFVMAFLLYIPIVAIFPGKFAATFTLGSILMLISVFLLNGPYNQLMHMISRQRIPFTIAYVGSMAFTLWASIGLRNYVLTIISSVLQLLALLWYFASYIPGGVATLRYGGWIIGRQASSLLPI